MIRMPVTISKYAVVDLSKYLPVAPVNRFERVLRKLAGFEFPTIGDGVVEEPPGPPDDVANEIPSRPEKLQALVNDLNELGAQGFQIVHRYDHVLIFVQPVNQKLVDIEAPELSRVAAVPGLRSQ